MGKEPRNTELPCWYPKWRNGTWRYDFRVEGIRERRSTGVRDPEAIEIAKKIAKGVHDAAWERALSSFPSFVEAADLYLAEYDKNRPQVERLKRHFGPFIRIDEIDAFTIKSCAVTLAPSHWKRGTVRKEITMPLKALLNNAMGLRTERDMDDTRQRILTPEKAERLIAVAIDLPSSTRDPDQRLLKMIAFLLGSGATPGEMFCVRASDINRATGEVQIRGVEAGAGKTKYRDRLVRLPSRAWELIGDLPVEGRVFLTTSGKEVVPDGRRGSHVIRQFHKLCAAAELTVNEDQTEKLVFYSLRHTWATWFSAQVGDHDLLIDQGGWADGKMARRYRKTPPADLADRLRAHGWEFNR